MDEVDDILSAPTRFNRIGSLGGQPRLSNDSDHRIQVKMSHASPLMVINRWTDVFWWRERLFELS